MSKKVYIRIDKQIEVGDLVRCVTNDWPFRGGDIRKVSRMGMDGKVFFYAHGSGEPLWQEFWEPVHKLKVGDRVVLPKCPERGICTVQSLGDKSPAVSVVNEKRLATWAHSNELNLYQTEKHDPKPTPLTSDGMVISGPNIYATTLQEYFEKTIRRDVMKIQIGEMIVELLDREDKESCPQSSVVISNWRDLDKTVTALDNGDKHHTATLSPSDTWDTLTGVYVALSKATGRKLPDWIYGDER